MINTLFSCIRILILSLVLLCLSLPNISANDGSFLAKGDQLFPLRETRIELKQERLKLTCTGEWMVVEVHFTFHNPDNARSLTVGFVTPPANGDVSDEEQSHPQIKDFQTTMNGEILSFQTHKMKDSGFKNSGTTANGNDFIYHFKALFRLGSNTIVHKYKYRGGSSVDLQRTFNYRLTTGTMWGNGQVDDFELEINMGQYNYFSLPYSFMKSGAKANWQLKGEGNIAEQIFKFMPIFPDWRMAFTRTGSVILKTQNFKPDFDLSVNIPQRYHYSMFLENEYSSLQPFFYDLYALSNDTLEELSNEDLQVLRNFLFAKHGYAFKKKRWREFFSIFPWYIANPQSEVKPDNFNDADKILYQKIMSEEARR